MRTLRALFGEPSSNTGIATQFAAVRAEMCISQLFHTNETSENFCQRLDAVVVRDFGGGRRVPAGHPLDVEARRNTRRAMTRDRYRISITSPRRVPSAMHMSQNLDHRGSFGSTATVVRGIAHDPRGSRGLLAATVRATRTERRGWTYACFSLTRMKFFRMRKPLVYAP